MLHLRSQLVCSALVELRELRVIITLLGCGAVTAAAYDEEVLVLEGGRIRRECMAVIIQSLLRELVGRICVLDLGTSWRDVEVKVKNETIWLKLGFYSLFPPT